MSRESKTFEKLYHDYSAKVYSLSRFKGLSQQDSEDIVQETFAAVFASYHSFQNKSSMKTYIVSIANHKIADYFRKRYRQKEEELDEQIVSAHENGSLIEKTDVRKEVESLTDEQQELLHMIFTQGLSYKEAAAVLGIPEGTVKSRMYGIRKALKEGLGADYR